MTGKGGSLDEGGDDYFPNLILASRSSQLHNEDGSVIIGSSLSRIAGVGDVGSNGIIIGGHSTNIGRTVGGVDLGNQQSVAILGGETAAIHGPPAYGSVLVAGQGVYVSGGLHITGTDGEWCQITSCDGGGGGGAVVDGDTTIISNTNVAIGGAVTISGDVSITGSTTIGADLRVSGCLTTYACITDSSSTSLTLDDTYLGKIIHLNPASDSTITLPSSFVGLKDGWQTTVLNLSANKITFTAGGGTNLYSFGHEITGQYQAATVYYENANWYGAGALT